MDWCLCKDCRHEFHVDEDRKCDWCGSKDLKILEDHSGHRRDEIKWQAKYKELLNLYKSRRKAKETG